MPRVQPYALPTLAACAGLAAGASPPCPPSAFPVQQHFFNATVDHFNYQPTPMATFPLRYYTNTEHWDAATGPVFFYSGNEADIIAFVNNSGFMFEAAQEFGAMVVFAEHRYYGLSNPFGDEYALGKGYNVSFLTVEQAMEDFNTLNVHLRRKYSMPPATAFVVFGGSYGGNLAVWLRLKNPNLWAGAIGSSATPLKHLLRQSNAFARIVTEAYGNVSQRCPQLVREGWRELLDGAKTKPGRASTAASLGLCSALPDESSADDVIGWLDGALETMVQYGYPYPTHFYNPVPGFPFKVACEGMLANGTGLGALRAAASVYYNYTGQAGPCFDIGDVMSAADEHWRRTGQHDKRWRQSQRARGLSFTETNDGWGYQCCTEVYQPMPTNGITDFNLPSAPNRTDYFNNCRQRWGVEPRPNWEEMHFMGSHIGAGSNIFLASGQLDPWRAAGIVDVPKGSRSIVVRIIEQGAHHYDLRGSNPLDTQSVIDVRREERASIKQWIAEWAANNRVAAPEEAFIV